MHNGLDRPHCRVRLLTWTRMTLSNFLFDGIFTCRAASHSHVADAARWNSYSESHNGSDNARNTGPWSNILSYHQYICVCTIMHNTNRLGFSSTLSFHLFINTLHIIPPNPTDQCCRALLSVAGSSLCLSQSLTGAQMHLNYYCCKNHRVLLSASSLCVVF